MDRAVEFWAKLELLRKYSRKKDCFYEKRDKILSEHEINSFQRRIKEIRKGLDTDNHDGAVLFAVCRGSYSEGYDFADHEARCVILIGIPNIHPFDPSVVLQKHFLDRQNGTLTG